jgi:D-serine deaminase-like pyridoxal phosphate-dependent protein
MGYREELDTPALVVHEDILKRNIASMAEYAKEKGIAMRPHFKTHKTAEVARMQQEAGAAGITCAKVGEVEALVEAGIEAEYFIANEVVGPLKTARLVKLLDRVPVRVAVDSVECAQGLQDAVSAAGKKLDIVLEVNTGQNRAGLLPDEILPLAEKIRESMPDLRIVGIMTHEGHAGKTETQEELTAVSVDAGTKMVNTAEQLREHGFEIETVSVGSTPAAFETTRIDGITEMRPGTYVFQDNTIFRFGQIGPDDCALRILATVTSRPAPDRAILDSGSKVLTVEPSQWRPGHGFIVEYPEATIVSLSEEHAVVSLPESMQGMKIGDKVEVIPNHVCPTVNLTDELFVIRDGAVVETWPVIARGRVR